MSIFSFCFRALRKLKTYFLINLTQYRAYIRLLGNDVKFDKTLVCKGLPIVDVHRTGICQIGSNCIMNSHIIFNPIGRYSPVFLIVREDARLVIGNNVGISSSAIICHKEIIIGDGVKLGGNVVIYDTDFHSLNVKIRQKDPLEDRLSAVSESVILENNVFIGAHSTILKGVIIGEGAIVGACSVVAKNIPPNEIWAGNPARFIKTVD